INSRRTGPRELLLRRHTGRMKSSSACPDVNFRRMAATGQDFFHSPGMPRMARLNNYLLLLVMWWGCKSCHTPDAQYTTDASANASPVRQVARKPAVSNDKTWAKDKASPQILTISAEATEVEVPPEPVNAQPAVSLQDCISIALGQN